MADLAINRNGEHIALNSIAGRQNVSENYLEQVFSTLRKAGLVKSVKGAQGGYMLMDKPSNITVGTVLRTLEGNLSVVDEDTDANDQARSVEYCILSNVWGKIDESIIDVVDSITLEDLVNEYKKLNGNMAMMYYI